MANTYSALKRVRQEERRTIFNRRNKTRLRRQIRAMRRALLAKDAQAAAALLPQTFSIIDRSAKIGIIKKNTAARYALQGFTNALMKAYHRPVFSFTFSSLSKAALGNDFLALLETSRFKHFCDDYDRPGADAWWFLIQAEHCGYELAAGQPIERGLRWGVSASARIRISADETLPVHNDE